jgi:DNA-binding response OmpR family regulator
MRILVADTDTNWVKKLSEEAEKHNMVIDHASNGMEAIKRIRRNSYDALITEVSLPDVDGVLACRQIRKISNLPILFLSSKNKPSEKMAAFEAGADDYVLKPCYLPEIFARLQVHLRRKDGFSFRLPLCIDGIMVDKSGKILFIDNRKVEVTPKEFELLALLCENVNIALSRSQIIERIWGADFLGDDRTIDSHIRSLRRKIEPYHTYIRTVWGYGYKLSKE